MALLPNLSRPFWKGRVSLTAYDLIVAGVLMGVLFAVIHVGRSMTEAVAPTALEISLDISALPYYAFRSVARMFIAYSWALLFTFTYGSLAAHSRTAERVLMPLLDILQSIPVLGFLSATITAFIALFPGSMMGMELAAIFAIFTSQAWNMAFSFFQSVRAIPRDLHESALMCRLTPFQRFLRLEVPFAMNGLVWNSMVSFGGGWFFLAASEAITVLGQDIRLPGIGSYLATAVASADWHAIWAAIVAMVLLIVVIDFFFFRPLLAWAQRFSQGSAMDEEYESSVLTALQRSNLVEQVQERVVAPITGFLVNRLPAMLASGATRTTGRVPRPVLRWIGRAVWITIGVLLAIRVVEGLGWFVEEVSTDDLIEVVLAGGATLVRVLCVVAIASVVWVPIGTYIGMRPAFARRLRPVIQLGAAFPANLVFPLLVLLFVHMGLDLSYGAVILMTIATQWYILFNVIVGALTIPEDLKEVGKVLRLSRWQRFRNIVAPVVMPYWVTGALTAAGGAWNASIVAEVALVGDDRLTTFGLGSYMTRATAVGDWKGILLSIATMCILVVASNRFIWRRLYLYAEEHLKIEEP